MTLVAIPGEGLWMPTMPQGWMGTSNLSQSDAMVLDADEEEAQFLATVHRDGGGSATFGISGSTLAWLPGASLTFDAGAILRVGLKNTARLDLTAGPPARATIGAAAFDVYKDLVGGTDTITATTWREDAMAAGTPFTLTHGSKVAVCFHLDVASGTPNVKVRCGLSAAHNWPAASLITAGPTYTAQILTANLILTCDDGSLAWLLPTYAFSALANSSTIGNTNIQGNIFQVPFACKIDALAATVNPTTGAANFALDLYATPLGTPVQMATVAFDANLMSGSNANRLTMGLLATPQTLEPATDYCVGIRQTTATAVSAVMRDVATAAHFKTAGLDATCYAANSTAGGTFVAENSGRRRYLIWTRVSHLDDGVSPGGGGVGRRMAIGVP
jgi:hypothetical protein